MTAAELDAASREAWELVLRRCCTVAYKADTARDLALVVDVLRAADVALACLPPVDDAAPASRKRVGA